jgi:hypothetical protein
VKMSTLTMYTPSKGRRYAAYTSLKTFELFRLPKTVVSGIKWWNPMTSCEHAWLVVEESRSINEYTGLENGWQRCIHCHEAAHFTRDVNEEKYPHAVPTGD